MSFKDYIANYAGRPQNQIATDKVYAENMGKVGADPKTGLNLETLYKPVNKHWWTQQPYTFVFNKEYIEGDNGGGKYTFNLPISPSNISITTHFATNIVTTMYGTVEEHSEQRYFDINIAGTTGMSPSYSSPKYMGDLEKASKAPKSTVKYNVNDINESKRASFTAVTALSEKAGGFLKRTGNLIETVASQATNLIDIPKPIGISTENVNTGYMAFHNFYRFLLKYKQHTSSRTPNQPKKFHPLTFINWKDGNQYDVVITNFQLLREANNPMLYNYSISMRAYNLQEAGASLGSATVDQINLLKYLGLDKVGGSIKAEAARKARSVRNAAYAAIALTKVAGQ